MVDGGEENEAVRMSYIMHEISGWKRREERGRAFHSNPPTHPPTYLNTPKSSTSRKTRALTCLNNANTSAFTSSTTCPEGGGGGGGGRGREGEEPFPSSLLVSSGLLLVSARTERMDWVRWVVGWVGGWSDERSSRWVGERGSVCATHPPTHPPTHLPTYLVQCLQLHNALGDALVDQGLGRQGVAGLGGWVGGWVGGVNECAVCWGGVGEGRERGRRSCCCCWWWRAQATPTHTPTYQDTPIHSFEKK